MVLPGVTPGGWEGAGDGRLALPITCIGRGVVYGDRVTEARGCQ